MGNIRLDSKVPWPYEDRLAQTDPRLSDRPKIKPYGCAMMVCAEVGRKLSDGPAWTPLAIVALYDEALAIKNAEGKPIIRADCYVNRWVDLINLAARETVVESIAQVDKDHPLSLPEIVIDVWKRQDREVGVHFTWEHQWPDGTWTQYDPLNSADPAGMSWSRKLGIVVSRRALRIAA